MSEVVIQRCPICPTICQHAATVANALQSELGITPRIEDGTKGEFSVMVDGNRVMKKTGEDLPSVNAVEAAVMSAMPVGV